MTRIWFSHAVGEKVAHFLTCVAQRLYNERFSQIQSGCRSSTPVIDSTLTDTICLLTDTASSTETETGKDILYIEIY